MAQAHPFEAGWAAAAQFHAQAGIRGMLAAEAADNPEVGALVIEVTAEGEIDVTVMSVTGQRLSGYSL